MPLVQEFVPAHANSDIETDPKTEVGGNILKLEELEAIRLKDLEGLEQADCAVRMEVSRPTFQRILISAREKIADSLIYGKAIRIEGGNYTRNICPVRCLDCGREWNESLENIEEETEKHAICPKCHSARLSCCPDDGSARGEYCRRRCRHHGA